ncbi:unnamed protein product [Adineta steineri]|uniref:Sacsin/Nov domain-containing protein n=2 Tax=Adineta steineri TaxID=433720 RepID=A0A819LKI0_9BILA|nr:unnamed protein product [Adineta steineri]CAF3967394.1 unnamed protein product [Adineta steineri]
MVEETTEIKNLSSDDLWLEIINEGIEDRVEVNQRMLIDKMLARYSSDFVVYRELIQNSDDAHATSFILQIKCDLNSNKNLNESNSYLEDMEQIMNNKFGINQTSNLSENDFHNCLINEIRTINNGNIFNEDDWKRVITIAEGNTNIDAVGQFGVGFFSVFSYSEKPMIQSGKHCLAFAWQNGKSLTTFRKELSLHEQSSSTSVILPMKTKYILQTKSILDNKSNKDQIKPIFNLIQLKAYLTKVLSFTRHINEIIIQINNIKVFQVNKIKKPLLSKDLKSNNQQNFLHFKLFTQTEQTFNIMNGPSITLNHIDVESEVKIDDELHKKIENVLKKRLPSIIHIELLFPSNQILEKEQWNILTNNQILKDLIPLKYSQEKYSPSGQIFIGLGTHQSTGVGMHIYSHLIPTIERENIDLQDPYISIWNEQLLKSIGYIIRLIYDQTILDAVNNHSQHLNTILSFFAFQTSIPNKAIGKFLLDGFFSFDEDIRVPVQQYPSDDELLLISSREVYVSNSKHIEKFLSIPLVPFDIGQNEFIQILKHHERIQDINNEIILEKIRQSIFLYDELIELLHWLCTTIFQNKSYIKEILSEICYRETYQSSIIQLENIQFYNTLNLSSLLPLPSNVLPSNIVNHISQQDLQRKLSLSKLSIKTLIQFYLVDNQHYLFENEITSKILLHFLSQHWIQFNSNESNHIKTILSKLKCISTNQGMKLPQESYIPSSNISENLPIISSEDNEEYPLSIEFFKSIGCRTMHFPTTTYNSSFIKSTDNNETLQNFIQDLLKQRKTMSDTDLNSLKNNSCLIGTTLEYYGEIKRKYKGNELHFPSVARELQWKELLIIDWIDINPISDEYFFLKELGVKEAPDLQDLLFRIAQEHYRGSRIKSDYKLPHSLIYFAENFRKYYLKAWQNNQIRTSFLPSSPPEINQSSEIILATPQSVFKESNPLCPSLLPDVIQCFSHCFDISLLGIKLRPDLETAFNILMDKRYEILTVESAPIYFAYLNKLDGLNKTFIEKVSYKSFIPHSSSSYSKPSQVFIRSETLSTSSDDETATAGLIDYVDYGPEANSFLFSIGVVSYPSAENLIELLIERQSFYFSQTNENTDEMIKAKLRVYTNCLKQLASISNIKQKFQQEPLKSRLINKSWCLGYQIIKHENGNNEKVFQIAKPSDIYLDDDHQSAIDLQPLCAPDEADIIKLYETFGAKWLSESVKRTLIHTGLIFTTERSKQLYELIDHRLDMLFVNKRGEYLENIDEKRLDLLRKNFSVYESEGIQCEITFQYRTITLDKSTNCSSCVLEYDKNQVNLYIHKDLPTLDYIDIASELIRFIHKKPLESLVHSISDKLSSPLETLKRRGIPVDRFLKQKQQQQQPIKLVLRNEQQQFSKFDDYYQQSIEKSSKEYSSPIEKYSSNIERNCIDDFREHQSLNKIDINQMLKTSRSYFQNEFHQSECSRQENNNLCEYVPSSNMIRHETLFHNIPLYIDENVRITNTMIKQGKQLAYLLSSLATHVFHISQSVIHLFRDINSARVAFNTNGALFFNLRYFEQVFAKDLEFSLENNSTIRTIINFYFLIFCHELTHNIHLSHDLNFIHCFESVIVKFMDEKELFLSKFSFRYY